MPFTSNKAFKQSPRLLGAAQGMYYTSTDVARLRRCRGARVRERRAWSRDDRPRDCGDGSDLDFAPSFQMGHPLSFALATERRS